MISPAKAASTRARSRGGKRFSKGCGAFGGTPRRRPEEKRCPVHRDGSAVLDTSAGKLASAGQTGRRGQVRDLPERLDQRQNMTRASQIVLPFQIGPRLQIVPLVKSPDEFQTLFVQLLWDDD